jgi:hypothetical protein
VSKTSTFIQIHKQTGGFPPQAGLFSGRYNLKLVYGIH